MLSSLSRARKALAAVCYCLIAALPILAAPPAQAAAPQVRTQAPGFYRMMLGDFEITALSDGTHAFPIDSALQNTSASEVARDLAQVELTQPVQGSINAFLINTGSKLILIDTGAGALYGPCCGRLLAHLRAAGYQPAQVDEILLTHLHKDHVGGVLAQGVAAFPNAILRVAAPEAAYWLDASHKASAPDFLGSFFDSAIAAVAPYKAAGHYQPINANGPLEPGISVQLEPGHTPGHATYRIESRGKVLLVWGDIHPRGRHPVAKPAGLGGVRQRRRGRPRRARQIAAAKRQPACAGGGRAYRVSRSGPCASRSGWHVALVAHQLRRRPDRPLRPRPATSAGLAAAWSHRRFARDGGCVS